MFDVLVYLFETYYNPQACPTDDVLVHKLAAVGFENDEIHDALDWLRGLDESRQHHSPMATPRSSHSKRIFTAEKQHHFDTQALCFIHYLESLRLFTSLLREILINPAI